MSEKTIGYSLLVIGIIIMIFATFQIIGAFTGRANPIAIFQYEKQTSRSSNQDSSIDSLLNQLQNGSVNTDLNLSQTPNIQLFDPLVINKILNLTVYYLIMQFLLGLGFKLSSLGVQLLRPIQVNMKNRTFDSTQNNITTQT